MGRDVQNEPLTQPSRRYGTVETLLLVGTTTEVCFRVLRVLNEAREASRATPLPSPLIPLLSLQPLTYLTRATLLAGIAVLLAALLVRRPLAHYRIRISWVCSFEQYIAGLIFVLSHGWALMTWVAAAGGTSLLWIVQSHCRVDRSQHPPRVYWQGPMEDYITVLSLSGWTLLLVSVVYGCWMHKRLTGLSRFICLTGVVSAWGVLSLSLAFLIGPDD